MSDLTEDEIREFYDGKRPPRSTEKPLTLAIRELKPVYLINGGNIQGSPFSGIDTKSWTQIFGEMGVSGRARYSVKHDLDTGEWFLFQNEAWVPISKEQAQKLGYE